MVSNVIYRQDWSHREIFGRDPIVRFEEKVAASAIELDLRADEAVIADARHHADPVVREYSMYQLAYRRGEEALGEIERALHEEKDSQTRVNLLWLLQEIKSEQCKKLALAFRNDPDLRVQEWARVFAWEMGWAEDFRRRRHAKYYPDRQFDETVFLHIKCHLYTRLADSNDMWGHVYMSPQTLARVYGQALACPVTETREHTLVLSKTLKGLHADGSDHYEAFEFKGFTERRDRLQGNFYFEAHAKRPFYLSGKADDASEGVIEDVTIPFAREGQWFLNEDIKIKDKPAIEFVRGRFQGWAYVNTKKVEANGGEFLFPGNSVLGTLHHPVVGPMTNTFLTGTFKGKIVDWDGDGELDLNYLDSHATRKGEIDSNLDGIPDEPGRSVCLHSHH